MTATLPPHLQLMPGSFSPDDYIELHYNPFDSTEEPPQPRRPAGDTTQQPQAQAQAVKRKALTVPQLNNVPTELAREEVDWHRYNPPALLRKAPTVTSQILLEIVESSIENVKTRVAEEDRVKDEERERRKTEEDAAERARRSRELFLPIIIPEDAPATEPSPVKLQRTRTDDARRDALSAVQPTLQPAKIPKKSALRRLFQRSNPVNGESSAAGASREVLRKTLRARLSTLDVNTANMFAQQAISAFGGENLTPTADSDQLVECVSCLDEFPSRETIRVPCHEYCSDCFVRLITAACQNEQQWPPKCCLNPIPFRTILRVVPKDLKKTFQARSREWELPVSERVYCSQGNCSLWIKPDQISQGMRQGRCDRGHLTCTLCRGESHGQEECPQDQDMNLTNQLAEEEGWKRCYSCHALVEHREACQHMTCRCGTQFCYVCGERWKTCSCTMQQLYDLKEAANARRQQREFRESEEAAELQRILAQIEEFERAEALAAELRRQEEERLEEERRQREIEERVMFESLRRRDVGEKFRQMRDSLNELHELQQVLVEFQQETNIQELAEETLTVKAKLAAKQDAEREKLTTLILDRLHQKEQDFKKEFAVRVAEEKVIEEDYLKQLQEYWDGRDGATENIDAAMLPLRQRMDQGCRQWEQWKDEQLAAYRNKLEDKRVIQEELMYSAKLRLDDQYEEKKEDLARQTVAEGRWCHEVVVERERLLNEYELQELEGDADSLFTPNVDGDADVETTA